MTVDPGQDRPSAPTVSEETFDFELATIWRDTACEIQRLVQVAVLHRTPPEQLDPVVSATWSQARHRVRQLCTVYGLPGPEKLPPRYYRLIP